jgi:hypothetical protein
MNIRRNARSANSNPPGALMAAAEIRNHWSFLNTSKSTAKNHRQFNKAIHIFSETANFLN